MYPLIPILNYHHVVEKELPNMDYKTTIKKFIADLKSLYTNGYTPIKLESYISNLDVANNYKNPIVITFDDGYSSFYDVVYPIIKQMSIPCTMFVVASMMGEVINCIPHFTIGQANEMIESNLVSIQSHGLFHKDNRVMLETEFETNIKLSSEFLNTVLKNTVKYYSYPNEGFTEKTVDYISNFYTAQFISIFDLTEALFQKNCIGRINVGYQDNIIDLVNLYKQRSTTMLTSLAGLPETSGTLNQKTE